MESTQENHELHLQYIENNKRNNNLHNVNRHQYMLHIYEIHKNNKNKTKIHETMEIKPSQTQ